MAGLAARLLAALLAASVFVACSAGRDTDTRRARGVIVDVTTASITRLLAFELRTDDGQRIRFLVEGDVGFTASHTREHMILAETVTVTYRDSTDGPVAIRIED